jgi:hypothetical protein
MVIGAANAIGQFFSSKTKNIYGGNVNEKIYKYGNCGTYDRFGGSTRICGRYG